MVEGRTGLSGKGRDAHGLEQEAARSKYPSLQLPLLVELKRDPEGQRVLTSLLTFYGWGTGPKGIEIDLLRDHSCHS